MATTITGTLADSSLHDFFFLCSCQNQIPVPSGINTETCEFSLTLRTPDKEWDVSILEWVCVTSSLCHVYRQLEDGWEKELLLLKGPRGEGDLLCKLL